MNNTVVRTLSGAVYGALIFCSLLINGYFFAALIVFSMCAMMVEFYRMTMGESYKFSRALAIGAGVILFLLLYFCKAFHMPGKYVALAIIPILIVMFNSLLVKDKSEFTKFAFIYTCLLYIAVPMSLSNLLAFREGTFSGLLLL
jgi:phosphatidate cytidylyltransferase